MRKQQAKPGWMVALMIVALVACVWIGWRDFDPYVPQLVVQEGIRSGVRGTIQVVVQFVAPVVIGVLLGRELLARRWAA